MYSIDQLKGFADDIQDTDAAQRFRGVVETMTFDEDGLCVGAALDAFNGTGLEGLRADFESNHIQYLTQETLLKLLSRRTEE